MTATANAKATIRRRRCACGDSPERSRKNEESHPLAADDPPVFRCLADEFTCAVQVIAAALRTFAYTSQQIVLPSDSSRTFCSTNRGKLLGAAALRVAPRAFRVPCDCSW